MSIKKLSPEQIDEFKQTFRMIDADGDGCITPSQLRTIMKKFSYSPSEEEITAMIKHIDTDKSGTIELSEFLHFVQNQMADDIGDGQDELVQAFKIFDKDGNGLITKQELREGLNKLGQRISEKDLNELIEAADLDGDGNINFEEFVELMKYN